MAMNIKNKEYDINNYEEIGNVKVSDEVIMIIAGLAATEIEGVFCIAGGITGSDISKAGAKRLSRAVRISFEEDVVQIDLGVTLEYGYSIPKISAMIQERVKNTVENMTGLTVKSVNVQIAGVNLDKIN